MQTFQLSPHSFRSIQYNLTRPKMIAFEVITSGAPVTTFLVDYIGLAEVRSGQPSVASYGGFPQRYQHYQELKLPIVGAWWLVIANPTDIVTNVTYEVRY